MTAPPPPWRRTPSPRRRAAKQMLSQELIVKTALEILAAEGIDAVSMRRVAQQLETGPASLYAYVANKEELDELMLDAALSEVPCPEPDPRRWTEQVKEQVRHQIRAMMAYPGIAKVAWRTPIPVTPNSLWQGEVMLQLLRAGGLDLKQAVFAGDALSTYAKAFAYEASGWTFGDYDPEEMSERGRQMAEYMRSLPTSTFPNLLQAGEFFTAETSQPRLEFALEAFVAGLAAMVKR
ncbi:TetR/AcrR family transcriptional regulator [Amycolatopsis echigonensis]|uniref:TetR/AcrR family transcriptional regulator n=1 Tax=Amycolatopsis echigonensis TaxID=2576905 RepID=A0A8E2B9P1_9PSEU|nr:TetR/AcrR family transcriptional regulator [Amycolatopsis echigonensis]MBB2504243.1 TetR/AcrR family transcriptional regulator [Amycolatopsis echigonensis]